MARISVVVPVYNVEKYLKPCIESILCQTFVDYELLLIDDGSTDKSGAICDQYAEIDKRIKVIHKDNEGLSATRNLGIEISTGKYIVFLDSDDWMSSTFFSEAIEKSEKEDADIYMAGYARVYPNGECRKSCIKRVIYGYSDELLEDDYVDLFRNNYNVHSGAKLIRKSVMSGLRFECDSIWAEDLRFNLALFRKHLKIIAESTVAYFYRVGHISMISSVSMIKCKQFVYTYELLYQERELRGFKKGQYQLYLDERLYEDLVFYEQQIIESRNNVINKTKLLKTVLDMPGIKGRIKHTRCIRHISLYGKCSLLLILRHRIGKSISSIRQ